MYYLPRNYVFKVKFDSPVSTELYKTGSIVQFSVVENVFGIRLPDFENEAALTAFTQSLDALIDDFEREIAEIQNKEREQVNQIAKSQPGNPKNRAERVEEFIGNTDEELRILYVDQATRLKELFERQSDRLIEEIERKHDSGIAEVREEFRRRTNRINASVDALIEAIPPNDASRVEMTGKLNFQRNEQLEQLGNEEAEEIEKLAKRIRGRMRRF